MPRLPIVEPYFTRLPEAKKDPLKYSLANNGWIWNANPLANFAMSPSKAYLRREVIVWGDCVKLRYGSGPEDNPWLWDYMIKYATTLASAFQGFRIDNCHSTPLHVGVRVLDAARVVNPNLYVCAELFTGSEEMDLLFVSRLGLNSLVREAGNAWDPKEFSRLLYRHGVGKPLGQYPHIPSDRGVPQPIVVMAVSHETQVRWERRALLWVKSCHRPPGRGLLARLWLSLTTAPPHTRCFTISLTIMRPIFTRGALRTRCPLELWSLSHGQLLRA